MFSAGPMKKFLSLVDVTKTIISLVFPMSKDLDRSMKSGILPPCKIFARVQHPEGGFNLGEVR